MTFGFATYSNEKILGKFELPKEYWLGQRREKRWGGGDRDSFHLRVQCQQGLGTSRSQL